MNTNVVPMGRTAAALRVVDGVDDDALVGLAQVGGVKWLLGSVDTKRAIACAALAEGVPMEIIEQIILNGGLKHLVDYQMKQLAANTAADLFKKITVANEARRQMSSHMLELIGQIMEELKRA